MVRSFKTISHEIAGRVLALQRGMNSPEKRLELASEIEATIERYMSFEKGKARVRPRVTKKDA